MRSLSIELTTGFVCLTSMTTTLAATQELNPRSYPQQDTEAERASHSSKDSRQEPKQH